MPLFDRPFLTTSPRDAFDIDMARLADFSADDFDLVAHRGASGYRPEHTLEAYRVAIEQGADIIEPDLVPTKDGVLVARHENLLNDTTDVAEHPEFAERYTTKSIDGSEYSGWFTEDFTLAELKTLGARERIPEIRGDNIAYNDKFEIATLDEMIELVRQVEAETGREIGIIPELKHPTYFEKEGTLLDGERINIDTSQLLIDTLVAADFTDPSRMSIQSFEVENLMRLDKTIMPAAGVDLPLVQLIGGGGTPWDIQYNLNRDNDGANRCAYKDLDIKVTAETTYSDLWTPEGAMAVAGYADILGPSKSVILPTRALSVPVDGDGNGQAQVSQVATGKQSALVANAHAAGLEVVPYTVRNEESFQALHPDGTLRTPVEEYVGLISTGIDGVFTDFPANGRQIIDQLDAGAGVIAHDRSDIALRELLVLDSSELNVSHGTPGLDVALYSGDGTLTLPFNVENARLRGTDDTTVVGHEGNNIIAGNAGDNVIYSGGGSNMIDGGYGHDVLVLPGQTYDYNVMLDGGRAVITDRNGDQTHAINIQEIGFSDSDVRWGLFATGQAEYSGVSRAFLGSGPDAETQSIIATYSLRGIGLEDLGGLLPYAPGFNGDDEVLSDSEFVQTLYTNVLGQSPDDESLAFWTGKLEDEEIDRRELAWDIGTSDDYAQVVALVDPGQEWWAAA
ncbi:glycerophosphodiester phosphodiesterase family protein [Kushneria indalinina]|uniref:glycerophosphodiester phosphodiesterase n=1 Tax=Kushneria indalinina DSM 14324 TaxID=1122140 RepID=A0A3D9DXL0_9GAMM|nr:glycerophosphodiester phosphodiesterase family protein [Kushneria indalinina]REC95034.1 glycerophosphoryl diester phosphodiesterase [Kushneria indalinina DSM 14324]